MRYSAEQFHPTEGGAEEGEMGCQEGEVNSETSRTEVEDQERSHSNHNNTINRRRGHLNSSAVAYRSRVGG